MAASQQHNTPSLFQPSSKGTFLISTQRTQRKQWKHTRDLTRLTSLVFRPSLCRCAHSMWFRGHFGVASFLGDCACPLLHTTGILIFVVVVLILQTKVSTAQQWHLLKQIKGDIDAAFAEKEHADLNAKLEAGEKGVHSFLGYVLPAHAKRTAPCCCHDADVHSQLPSHK